MSPRGTLPLIGPKPFARSGKDSRMSGSPPVEHADSHLPLEGPPFSAGPAVDNSLSLRPQLAAADDGLLEQVSQISGHLKAQLSEIDRREQTLTEQLAALDQERRTMRLWVQQF